jgi:hypothetical protein
VSGNHPYVADGSAGLQVIDVSNAANPDRVGGYDSSDWAIGVAVSGNYAYVADWWDGLQVIDVSNPANPRRVGGNPAFADARNLIVAGDKVFVAAGSRGLVILDQFQSTPLRLELPSSQQPGSFRLLVHGQAGLSVRVQRSVNMSDWEGWQTLTLGTTPAELSDLDAGAVPDRFYRAVAP